MDNIPTRRGLFLTKAGSVRETEGAVRPMSGIRKIGGAFEYERVSKISEGI